MARGYYSERWTVADLWGTTVLLHVTADLSDREIVEFFHIALSVENYEYCEVLEGEAKKRGFTIKNRKDAQ